MNSTPRLHVIDGYNLTLGSVAFQMTLERDGLRALRDQLFEAVARDCERRGSRALIVWDGADVTGVPSRSDPRGVEESFSRPPEKADERVIALAMQRRDEGHTPVVVSDDREQVRTDAERSGIPWLACEAYLERLFEPLSHTPHARDEGRHARRAVVALVAAGLMDEPGAAGDALVAELAEALAYSAVGNARKPHKMAKAVIRWLAEYGVAVRGGPHEQRAVLAPLWEPAPRPPSR